MHFRKRKWTKEQLVEAASSSRSVRQVLTKLCLIEAGGNYTQIKKFLHLYEIDTSHFQGMAWNKGTKGKGKPWYSMEEILVRNSTYQSHKLKKRLFQLNLKPQKCEICSWAQVSKDGRLPLELDHKNGDHADNRIGNLRILCPNCHSLQLNHRGKKLKT